MLNIKFGTLPDMIRGIDGLFRINRLDEWLDDPLVHEMVRDVDKSEVVSHHNVMSPIFGSMSPDYLSTGVKLLIMARFETEYPYFGSACGDNCNKWFLKIADIHEKLGMGELKLCYYHLPIFEDPLRIRILNSGNIVTSRGAFLDEYLSAKEVMHYEWDIYGSTEKWNR